MSVESLEIKIKSIDLKIQEVLKEIKKISDFQDKISSIKKKEKSNSKTKRSKQRQSTTMKKIKSIKQDISKLINTNTSHKSPKALINSLVKKVKLDKNINSNNFVSIDPLKDLDSLFKSKFNKIHELQDEKTNLLKELNKKLSTKTTKTRKRKTKKKDTPIFHSPSGNEEALRKHEENQMKLFKYPTAKSTQEIIKEKKQIIHDVSIEAENQEDKILFKFWSDKFNFTKKQLKDYRRYFQTLLRYDINNNITGNEYKNESPNWESGHLVKQIDTNFYLNVNNPTRMIRTRRGNDLMVRNGPVDYNIKQLLISLLYVMFGIINKKLYDNSNFPFVILFKGSRILHKYQNKNMDPYHTIDLDLILFPKIALNDNTISDKVILEYYYKHTNELKELSGFIMKLCKYWGQANGIVNLSILEPPEINSNSDSNKKIYKLSYVHQPPNRAFSALVDFGFTWNLQTNSGINNHSNTLQFFKSVNVDSLSFSNNEFYIKPMNMDLMYIYQQKQNYIDEKKYIRNKNGQESVIKEKMEKQLKYLNNN